MGFIQRALKIPELVFWLPPFVVMPLNFHILHLINHMSFFILGKKSGAKMVHFPILPTNSYIFSEAHNFGMKPMLLSNGEQFNKGPH